MNKKEQLVALAMASALVAGAACSAHAATDGKLSFDGLIESGTCDLAAGDDNRVITLPTVRVPDFNASSSAGVETNFDLTANCDPDVSNVTFTFSGTPLPAYSLLFNNTGTSSGVGLTLGSLIGGVSAPIHASNPDTLSRTVPTVAGQATLPLRALYWKAGSGAVVAKGTFASSVMVKITYD